MRSGGGGGGERTKGEVLLSNRYMGGGGTRSFTCGRWASTRALSTRKWKPLGGEGDDGIEVM